MSKTLETVKVADIHPLVYESGQEYASRDYTLKANQDYIAELAESMKLDGGVPREIVTLVRDGDIYRVKAGNCRVRAMQLLGTEECQALIDEDDTPQSALETAIKTDLKKRYEDVEMSGYVQQLALFGDDEYVSGVTGIEQDKVRRIRKARSVVDDSSAMTLDRMYAIAEFADDPDAVELLSTCSEADIGWRVSQLRRDRENGRLKAEFAEALSKAGVPCADSRDELYGMEYYTTAKDAGDVESYLPPEFAPGQVKAWVSSSYSGVSAEVYVSKELSGEDEEAAEIRRMTSAYEDALEALDESRLAWFWECVAEGRGMPNILSEVELYFTRDIWYVKGAIESMPEDARAEAANEGLSVYDYALGINGAYHTGKTYGRFLATGKLADYEMGRARAYLDEVAMYVAEGWEPGESAAVIQMLESLLGE